MRCGFWRGCVASRSSASGTTTARPMFHPVPLSHLAGRGFTPERRTPSIHEHAALRRRMDAGGQLASTRVSMRSRASRALRRSQRKCGRCAPASASSMWARSARSRCTGLMRRNFSSDVYTARFANLKVGMTRYGLMLDESGVVIDDGVIARLGARSGSISRPRPETRRRCSASSGGSPTWWGLPVGLVNLTGHYGGLQSCRARGARDAADASRASI